ncbi:MAG: efflux RND transporter permease subunit [Candidatus Omnitrophica bacterium]|nr:efflux RND transporter permease subunit [Candidatus Omnitrophota bacterium]
MFKEQIINFFLKRHLLANLIFITVFVGGIIAWNQIPKEELPDITFDTVRISVNYPGASAEEVEYYITRPIEEAVRSLDGIYKITSATGVGSSSVTIEIEKDYPDKDDVITEIRNVTLDVDLPDDVKDDPNIRVFKTSRKAIIDIVLFLEDKNILDVLSRQKLQSYALALENKLLSISEVSSISRSGYLDDEIHIKIHPEKLIEYRIPFNTIIREIQANNIRQPAGNIENIQEPKVTLFGELTDITALKNLAIQGGFEGQVIRLSDIADVVKGYEKTKTVTKINGREGIVLNVVKSSQVGIIEAIDAVTRVVQNFEQNNAKESGIKIALLDDESFDVRNRLSLIMLNGAIGFILIAFALFLFLDFRSGLCVAMGIPFTFCFALIAAFFAGYSVNNITLAAVIIVMGMVVDDAIVVSENISRFRVTGMDPEQAANKGTSFVFLPIIASILTTCVAFIPLYFFSGRFGAMVGFIPLIVFVMLGGSLFEALFILPGHMILPLGDKLNKIVHDFNLNKHVKKLFKKTLSPAEISKKHWFDFCERIYAKLIKKLLPLKFIVFGCFAVLLVISAIIGTYRMKFLMFPDEETRQIILTGEAPEGTQRYQTARFTQAIEDIILKSVGKEVVGFRNQVAQTRRGSAATENQFRINIEILPKEKREKSADQLIKQWEKEFANLENFKKLKFRKTWHGQSGESPIEILVKENNDERRFKICDELSEIMKSSPALTAVEIDRPILNLEYRIKLDRDKIRRLAINPSDIASTLRASLEGKILYDFMGDDEEIYVRLTTTDSAKDSIEKVLELPVENAGNYLVPLGDIVFVEKIEKPDSIIREDLKRTTTIFADIKPGSGKTPLDIADYFEHNVFSKIMAKSPSTIVEFAGEVLDTRESQKNFSVAILMAIVLIYIILALLFNSLFKPFIIMLTIPFGIVGIILAFWLHGISMYGFFAVIGALGLAGVVVNDAIIMLVKLDSDFNSSLGKDQINNQIAEIAKTRLRAVVLTTLTTVVGIIPTAYGWAGYDSMLAQMMLALCWGLIFGTTITLILIPSLYSFIQNTRCRLS